MLYLSQLALNPRSRQAQAEVRDPYQMHRTFAKAFPEGDEAQQAARCLFRVEESPHGWRVLVQSRTRPAWDRLTVGPDYWLNAPCVKEFTPRLAAGQALAFRLRANPTKRQSEKPGGKRLGPRVGLYTETDRLAWLERKAAASGFSLCTVVAKDGGQATCRTRHGDQAALSAVQFDGVLRITDPAVLEATLEAGMGTGKGLGFGLLSLALT